MLKKYTYNVIYILTEPHITVINNMAKFIIISKLRKKRKKKSGICIVLQNFSSPTEILILKH